MTLTAGLMVFPVTARAQDSAVAAAAAAAIGKEVSVRGLDGSRVKGTLVSFSTTEVVLRRPVGEVTLQLAGVREVQRGSHAIRNGAALGFAAGVGTAIVWCKSGETTDRYGNTTDNCYDGDYDFSPFAGVVLGGMGAGIGTAIGALVRASSRASRTIYKATTKTTVALAPAVGRASLGVAGTITW